MKRRDGGLIESIGASLTVLLGLAVLIGWHTHTVALVQVHPSFVPMQYNTALAFFLAGFGLLAVSRGLSTVACVFGALVAGIGGLTLVEYVAAVDLGIDQILMSHYITVATSNPGRMAPNTAINFVLIGAYLVGAARPQSYRWAPVVGPLPGALVVALGLVAFFGYLSGIETAYGWGSYTRMAVHTSAGFTVVGLTMLLTAKQNPHRHAARKTAWTTTPIAVSGFAMTICLWQALDAADWTRTSYLPEVVLVVGIVLSTAVTMAVRFAYVARRRSCQLRKSLKELSLSEQRCRGLADLVENSEDAIIGKSLDGIITSWNRGAEQLFGFTAAEMIGRGPGDLIPADRIDELPESMAKVKRGERVEHFETVRMRRDGTQLDVSLTVSPIRDVRGEICGVSVSARDISDRKALERQRRDFLAMLTHDIKNPLVVIAGVVEILREESDIEEKYGELVEAIQVNADTVVSLVTNHLSVARIESGELHLQPQSVDLGQVLRRVVDHYSLEARRRRITIDVDVPELPAVHVDAQAIERVFLNLVHNALKFTPDDGRVTVEGVHEASGVTVEIRDTGPGISAAEQPFLFRRYKQTSIGRGKKGTGMGLFIVKTIVESHGGSVVVDSKPGEGTAFRVVLPMAGAIELQAVSA